MSEGKELVERRIAELDRLSDNEIRRLEWDPVNEIVTTPSGKRFRVEVEASTAGSGEYDDDPELAVRVQASGLGPAAWQRYSGGIGRHQSVKMKRFNETGDVASAWGEWSKLPLFAAFLLATIGIWILGAIYLLVLLARLIF